MDHPCNDVWKCNTKISKTSSAPPRDKFRCPLTDEIMQDPVSVPCRGVNFERKAILKYLQENGNRCPLSGDSLTPSDLKSNTKLQWEILYVERQTKETMDWSVRSCPSFTTVSSALKVDSPPVHPRSSPQSSSSHKVADKMRNFLFSPRSRRTQKSSTTRSPPRYEMISQQRKLKIDLPPTMPRSPYSVMSLKSREET